MLIAGIIGQDSKMGTANLINLILSSSGKKVSIIDSKKLSEFDCSRLKGYLTELKKNSTDVLILKINIEDIELKLFEHIRLDIMIYNDKADERDGISDEVYRNLMRKSFSLLDEKGIALVNVDDGELIKFLEGIKNYIVTFGFNSKASITTSSIGDPSFDDNYMCCIQRTIHAKNGRLIEPQEYKIKVDSNESDPYTVLAAATFAIINGVDLNLS